MTESKSNADQIAFWNAEAGAKWVKAQARLDAMLAEITTELIKIADPAAGARVLDIGCGCGDTSLQLAARGLRVVGLDVSAPMLAHAMRRAHESDADIEFVEADAATHSFEPTFDLLVSRFGVMFFADADAAFGNLRKALRPAGRIAFVCWRDPRENEWVAVPVGAARPHAPPQPRLGPEEPGPFAFADSARVRRILSSVGFRNIAVRPFETQLALGETLNDAVAHLQEFGPVSRMLAEATDAQKAAVTNALREALRPYADRRPLRLGGAVWFVTATA